MRAPVRPVLGAIVGMLLAPLLVVGALLASVPRMQVPPPAEVRIAHATLVEPGVGRHNGQTVTVRSGRIASVAPSTSADAGGDWDGLFVMPGLVDLHVHLPPPVLPAELRATLLLFLAHGVTSVRDAGSPWGWSIGTRERVADGALPGPSVLSCGRFLTGETSWPGVVDLDGKSGVRAVIEELRSDGVDCVKVLDSIQPDVASAMREEAHAAGLRVIGHAPAASDRLLLDEVQHLTGLTVAMRTGHPAALEKAVVDSLAERVAHTPTLIVLERFARASEGRSRCDDACRFLPAYLPAVLWDPGRIPALAAQVSDLGFAPRERFEAAKRVVGALARGGVPILAGTDAPLFYTVPGDSLHEEIRLLHESGLSADEALAAATTRAALALGDPHGGDIVAGGRADLVLLRSDPVEAIERGLPLDVAAVIAGGRVYSRAELDAALRQFEDFFAGSVYAGVANAAAARLVPAPSD
jgi:imidazolonepropionase-like amidohydrolase